MFASATSVVLGGTTNQDTTSFDNLTHRHGAIVLFFKSVEKANDVVQSGVVLNGSLVPVLPLSSPSKKVILPNVPPFIKDEVLVQE